MIFDVLKRAEKAWPGDSPSNRQLMVLIFLHNKEPQKVRIVQAALGIPKPSITRAHTSLQKFGLVKRVRSIVDGRDSLISLTVAGEAFVESLGLEKTQTAPGLGRGL